VEITCCVVGITCCTIGTTCCIVGTVVDCINNWFFILFNSFCCFNIPSVVILNASSIGEKFNEF
jgi:hypothetical protein